MDYYLDLLYLGERNVLHHLNLEHVHPVHIALNFEVEPEAAGLEGFWRAGVIVVVGRWRQGGGPQLSHSDQVVAEVPGHVHLHVVDCSPVRFLLPIQDLRLRKVNVIQGNIIATFWVTFEMLLANKIFAFNVAMKLPREESLTCASIHFILPILGAQLHVPLEKSHRY